MTYVTVDDRRLFMETVFGPPSEPIDVAAFLGSAEGITATVSNREALKDLSEQKLREVLTECSVDDIRNSLFEIWNEPRLSAHLLKEHQSAVDCVKSAKYATKKRKATKAVGQTPVDVTNMQEKLDAIKLNSWKLQPESTVFIRTPRNTDYNVLRKAKWLSNEETPQGLLAIIVASVYKRTSWNPSLVTRISQHALLSSQTLDQLFDAIPCPSKEIPQEIMQDGKLIAYSENEVFSDRGCVICIEGHAYGDGKPDSDYAEKLMQHLDIMEKEFTMRKAPTSMQETKFDSLTVRINQPYWLLHAGNCEHFIVFDQIRLKHHSDPSVGYPLTLQITPLLLDLCRACSKVPAVWSILNDIRLGESPYLLCGPCWRSIEGGRKEGVVVVPLPAHRKGW